MASEQKRHPAPVPVGRKGVLRIVSDLHLGHPGSTIKKAEQLFPVLSGADHIIFNGDTIEEYANRYRPWSDRLWADLVSHMDAQGITFENLTGNHDPTLFKKDQLELLNGDVLITHGDFLFTYVSPWSGKTGMAKSELDKLIEDAPPADGHDLDARLALTRKLRTCLCRCQHQGPQGLMGKLLTLWRAVWPPTRPFQIVHTWRAAPGLAARSFALYRPAARFLIIGHTHKPYIRESPNGQVVINTGAYYALSKALVVDVHTDRGELRVLQVDRTRDAFEIGSERARYRLPEKDGKD